MIISSDILWNRAISNILFGATQACNSDQASKVKIIYA